jgi:hypothetical protein
MGWFKKMMERRENQRLREGYYGYVVVNPDDTPPVSKWEDVNPMVHDEVDPELSDRANQLYQRADQERLEDLSVKELLTMAAMRIRETNPDARRLDVDYEYVRIDGVMYDISFQVGRS